MGETLPPDAEPAKAAFVHAYEVANGVQLAVSVDESPRLMVAGIAVSVHTGTAGWVTVTVALAAVPVPELFVPCTE